MNVAARTHTPIRIGRTWLFPDGTRLPVVGGGDGEEAPPVLPDDLTVIEADALQALEDELVAEIDSLLDAESDDIAHLEELAASLEAVRTEKQTRVETAQRAADAREALRQRIHAQDETDEGDDGDDPGDGPAAQDDGGGDSAPTPAEDREREVVTASAPAAPARRAASASGTARRAGRPTVPDTQPRVVITAAADIPDVNAGARLANTDEVATAMHAKARSLSDKSGRIPIAKFTLPFDSDHMIRPTMSAEAQLEVIERASAPSALVAAGGWCTPSQNMYDLIGFDGQTGLLDVPTVGIERGGINVPSYIGLAAGDGALWTWTEDQDEDVNVLIASGSVTSGVGTANTTGNHQLVVGDMVDINTNTQADGPHVVLTITDADTFTFDATGVPNIAGPLVGSFTRQKGCFTIPCPTWTDYRLGAYGLCIRHGNLTEAAFPELSRRYVDVVMNAHMHRMSAVNIAKIRASVNSDAVTVTAVGTDSYGELMSALELQAADYRSQHKISGNVQLEVLLPSWTEEVLRTNLAMRAGVDMRAVSDAQIVAELNVRKIRPQFLEDYQVLNTGTPRTGWPTTIEFIMYPAGSIFEGRRPSIDLGVQRDSRLNNTNDFTVAWTEDFSLLGRRGPKGRVVTATLTTDGITACCP
jgi:hypothetical protein